MTAQLLPRVFTNVFKEITVRTKVIKYMISHYMTRCMS